MSEKLKIAVIREEYVAICGNYQLAIILNQMIYWSERIKNFDSFITEENARLKTEDLPELTLYYGWFYKSAKELSEELMTGWSERTIGRYIKELEKFGFITSRCNPIHKWDRTLQYRVNLNVIKKSLESQGYKLQGYREATSNRIGKMSDGSGKMSDRNNRISDRSDRIAKAIPETTPENTTTTTADSRKSQPLSLSPDNAVKKSPESQAALKKVVTSETEGTGDCNSAKSQPQSPSPNFKAEHDTLVSLIPEPMRQPVIINLVDKYHQSHGFQHVADCIVYTNLRPQREGNGTLQAYRGYLSKGLAGQYNGINGLYESFFNKKEEKIDEKDRLIISLQRDEKKRFILKDGRVYQIRMEGHVFDFEYINKNTGKLCKGTLTPEQIANTVVAGKATLE